MWLKKMFQRQEILMYKEETTKLETSLLNYWHGKINFSVETHCWAKFSFLEMWVEKASFSCCSYNVDDGTQQHI